MRSRAGKGTMGMGVAGAGGHGHRHRLPQLRPRHQSLPACARPASPTQEIFNGNEPRMRATEGGRMA